jgi:hypothetical protein
VPCGGDRRHFRRGQDAGRRGARSRGFRHGAGSFAGIAGVYQRFDFAGEKRAALETWVNFVERFVKGEPAGQCRFD